MNVVVTGANRGIGLGFVKHYLAQGAYVWACYRSDKKNLEMIDADTLECVQWDVVDDKDETFISQAGFPQTIDILINNAGIYGPKKDGQSLENITPDVMLDAFNVNCVGPLRVVQLLKPLVIAAAGKIANVSSKMGSAADNTSGGCYAYRASKACLIHVTKSMAIDLVSENVKVVSLHPGWVRTDMTDHNGLIDVHQSVAGMTKVIENIESYSPGDFISFDGQTILY